VPALVLHRRNSRQIPLETSASLAAALPHGELRILEGSTATLFFDDPNTVVQTLLTYFAGEGRPVGLPAVARRADGLTPRELEVLRLIAGGKTNADVAHRLSVSVHTVERHAVNLYVKIGARGRAAATAYALRHGLG
jgi:DNA-binding NarL/FixJ family response regulator